MLLAIGGIGKTGMIAAVEMVLPECLFVFYVFGIGLCHGLPLEDGGVAIVSGLGSVISRRGFKSAYN